MNEMENIARNHPLRYVSPLMEKIMTNKGFTAGFLVHSFIFIVLLAPVTIQFECRNVLRRKYEIMDS